jgi:hypothetical protein
MSLKLDTAVSVYAVVAICVLAAPAPAVGAVGIPVNAGLTFSPCTNAVVATTVEFVPDAAVGAVTVPVNAGPTVGAAPDTSLTTNVTVPVLPATDNTGADDLTNAVVAIFKLTSPSAGVGAVGTPANAGLLVTNAVVAICVVDVPVGAVGAVGTPVNAGLIFCACT